MSVSAAKPGAGIALNRQNRKKVIALIIGAPIILFPKEKFPSNAEFRRDR
jgi:hypothetical protein